MRYEVSAVVNASFQRVWSVLTDVERMPEWTSSLTRVQRLDDGPLTVGSTVRIKQPRLPVALWRVVELTAERSFLWATTSGGVTTQAGHTLTAGPEAATVVTFTVRQSGLLAPLVGLLTGALTRRYVTTELRGLKSVAENQPTLDVGASLTGPERSSPSSAPGGAALRQPAAGSCPKHTRSADPKGRPTP